MTREAKMFENKKSCTEENSATYVTLQNVSKAFGQAKAVSSLTLTVEKGEFFSLLGPSGCGKTTTLRLIAGLTKPDEGSIAIGHEVVSAAGVWVAPEKRGVGIVFQDYALFPHMTVFKNVAFGLKGCGSGEIKKRVMEWLSVVGLADLAGRYPHELSGGQRQRVALTRSLANFPKVILLDEPFSNLDADLRNELRNETKRILKESGTTTILVTHDQEEAFSLSDRIGILYQGVLGQVGTPAEIYHRPKSKFVADFVGKADFLPGKLQRSHIVSDIGTFLYNGQESSGGEDILLMVRPDDVHFVPEAHGDAVVADAKFLGPSIMYTLQLTNGRTIHAIKPSATPVDVGTKVKITVDLSHVVVLPIATK